MSCSQTESKFSHLLQPIRDLAANWDIDIAAELEDYLEVLESVTFSFEDAGGGSLNFAEAALVIQGSACVYGKKVQYLHTLVYQVLDFLAQKKKKEGRGGGKAEDDADEFDDEEQFLTLDDCLQEGTGIDMDEATSAPPTVPIRPPALLLPLEDSGGAATGEGEAGNYRIARCGVHSSGALLLEPRDGAYLNESLERVEPNCLPRGAGPLPRAEPNLAPTNAPGGIEPSAMDMDQGACGGADGAMSDDGADGNEYAGGDGWDGDGGGEMHVDDEHRGQGGDPGEVGLSSSGAHEGVNPPSAEPFGEDEDDEETFFDPWAPLDPNDPGPWAAKPFRKVSKPRLRQRSQRPKPSHPFGVPPANPGGLAFREFDYALPKAQQAKRGGVPRGRGDPAGGQGSLRSAFTREEAGAGVLLEDDAADDRDDYNDFVGPPSDDDDDGPGGGAHEGFPDEDALHSAAFWGAVAHQAGDERPDGDGEGPTTYEDRCRAHIEAFIRAAAAAEVQTELAARVGGWRARISPVLEEQDARPPFDIHESGSDILHRMSQLSVTEGDRRCEAVLPGPAVAFGDVAHETSQWQVSRLFSALLQLVNNGNVEVLRGDGTFQLRLLEAEMPVQDFSEATGPLGNVDLNTVKAAPAPSRGRTKEGGAAPTRAVSGAKVGKRRKAS